MSKFYLFITLFLMYSSVRCETNTTMACDKFNKERTGYLLQFDECFNLFLKDGLIVYEGAEMSIGNFVAKSGYCAKNVTVPDKEDKEDKNTPRLTESMIKFWTNVTVGNLTEIYFTIKVINDLNSGFWNINEILVSGLNEDVKFTKEDLEVPADFSYNCGNLELYRSKLQKKTGDLFSSLTKVTLRDFQVQPFKGPIFVKSFDCETWFTLGTFSGLIVLILFTFILAFGICYIMNIKTNDRFEDPKGKPLVIGNVDS